MKLRNIFTILAAVLSFAFVGCETQEQFLEDVKVSKSYIAIPKEGGEVKIDVDAAADWTIVAWDSEKQVEVEIPEWLSIEPASGPKGKTSVVFSAGETTESNEIMLHLNCGSVYQVLKVVQITEKQELSLSTCAWIHENAKVDVFYRVKATVVAFGNFEKYGAFEVNDGTSEKNVSIYGSNANTVAADLAIGDIVTFEGSWSKYNNFNNDTQIISVEKSLIKVEKVSPVGPLAADGDVFTVTLTNKGENFVISIPEADQAWLSYSEPFVSGTTTVVEFTAAANLATPRSTTITFSITSGGVEYTAVVAMEQDGSIPQRTIAEAVSSEELSKVVGKVIYLNGRGALISDGTDVLYGYTGAAVENVAVGDVVEMLGTVTKYNGGRSMNKPTIKASTANVASYTTPAPVVLDAAKFAEYTASDADFTTPYVSITGVAEVDTYNNIIVKLVDGETTYSVKSYYGLDSFADWAGQTVEVRGYVYNAYADSKQVNLLVTSVKEPLAALPTIAEVRGANKGDAVMTEGTVMAIHQKGYIISDETGLIYVYTNARPNVVVGNNVKLSGTFDNYYGTLQIKNATIESNDNATSVTYPTPIDLSDPAAYEAFATFSAENPTEFSFVKIKGVLSGDNNNIITVGTLTKTAQLDWSVEDYSALNGKTVVVNAFIKGFHSGGYYQLIETSVLEDSADLENPTTKAERNLAFSAATATATLGQEFTAPILSGETDGVAYSSSNTAVATVDAATGAVTLVAAGETTITATAAETETLQAGTVSYTLTVSAATEEPAEFEAGTYWIVESGFVGTPELKSGSYGYMIAEEAWTSSTGISSTAANAFTFEVAEGGYTIKDSKGRYLYAGKKNDGTYYNTFNASATATENHIWTVAKNADGTYKITNKASTFDVHFGASFKTFECVANVTDFPELVKAENAVPAVSLASSLTFEAEGGSQTITLPEGVTATPSCDNTTFTATSSANVVTVSAAATTEAQSGVLTLVLNYNGFAITKAVDLTQKAAPVAGETVVFEETFAKFNGTMGWSGSVANGNNTTADNENWTFVKVYGADGAAKFGTGSALGSAQTPQLNFNGTATLTFKAGAWDGSSENTTLKLSMTGGTLGVATVTLVKGAWKEYEVTITDATPGAQIKFEGQTAKNSRFFLDDVKIVKK